MAGISKFCPESIRPSKKGPIHVFFTLGLLYMTISTIELTSQYILWLEKSTTKKVYSKWLTVKSTGKFDQLKCLLI